MLKVFNNLIDIVLGVLLFCGVFFALLFMDLSMELGVLMYTKIIYCVPCFAMLFIYVVISLLIHIFPSTHSISVLLFAFYTCILLDAFVIGFPTVIYEHGPFAFLCKICLTVVILFPLSWLIHLPKSKNNKHPLRR